MFILFDVMFSHVVLLSPCFDFDGFGAFCVVVLWFCFAWVEPVFFALIGLGVFFISCFLVGVGVMLKGGCYDLGWCVR